jgi:hypothetical protein
MSSRGRFQRGVRGFIELVWSWCRVHLKGEDWAMQVVLLVRRRELCPGLGSARAGMQCLLRGTVGFRSGANGTVRGSTCQGSEGAGRGARRDGCTMLCTPVCRMARMSVCVRGNARAGRGVSGRRRVRAERACGVAYGALGRQRPIG